MLKTMILAGLLTGCVTDMNPEVQGAEFDDGTLETEPTDMKGAGEDFVPPVCWRSYYFSCNDDLVYVCVPYTGCATFECNGVTMGYCGPGEQP